MPIRMLLWRLNSPSLEKKVGLICGNDPLFWALHPIQYEHIRNGKVPSTQEEVMQVSVRERILTIRLMEKVKANPNYAKVFGIVIQNYPAEPERQTASNSAGNKS